jgi:hypothetical protein
MRININYMNMGFILKINCSNKHIIEFDRLSHEYGTLKLSSKYLEIIN